MAAVIDPTTSPSPTCHLFSLTQLSPRRCLVFRSWNACTIADLSAPIGMPHHGSGNRGMRRGRWGERGWREEGESGVGWGGGQVSGLSTSCRDQSLKLTERWSKGEEFERTRVKVRETPFLFLRVATFVNVLLFSNHPLLVIHAALKWIPFKASIQKRIYRV